MESTDKRRKIREFDFSKYGKRHVLLKIMYLGWDYDGFVVQDDTQKTIEFELFAALERTKLVESRTTSNYHRCGRTDKGVSAYSQVISIDLRSNRKGHEEVKSEEINYPTVLNRVLPKQIRVLEWADVTDEFSARFNCIGRSYQYYFPRSTLNIEAMRQAGQLLVGEKDFRNFCKLDVGNNVTHCQRNITSVSIEAAECRTDPYEICILKISAQAFLWHQIRCLVTILFYVGEGKEAPSIVSDLLDVNKYPSKPQYPLAADFPLNLFDCQFTDVKWIVDQSCQRIVLNDLHSYWAELAIKTTMVKSMLDDLKDKWSIPVDPNPSDYLTVGNKPQQYVPLTKRPRNDSLELKLKKHSAKRKLNGSGDTPVENVD